MAKIPAGVGPRFPQVLVLVGATGELWTLLTGHAPTLGLSGHPPWYEMVAQVLLGSPAWTVIGLFIITSYSIHYTKLYEGQKLDPHLHEAMFEIEAPRITTDQKMIFWPSYNFV